jgi:hypothetical protein
MSDNYRFLNWTNIIAFIVTIVVNGIAGGTTILGGKDTAQISDANPTLTTPAGYVFSIWGVIYILLGIFVIFQALPSQRTKEYHKKISWLFVVSSIFNICWIFLWQFQYLTVAVAFIFLLLASLIAIYLRLNIGRSSSPLRERLAVHLPFSVYLGWITIASIANVAVALVSVGWDGFGIAASTWALAVVIIALLISLAVIAIRRDIGYSLVIIWAFIGIAVNHGGTPMIALATEAGAGIVALAIATAVLLTRFTKKTILPPNAEKKV